MLFSAVAWPVLPIFGATFLQLWMIYLFFYRFGKFLCPPFWLFIMLKTTFFLYRGSYMSAHVHVLLKKIRSVFPNEFNKFNNTGAWLRDAIDHVTLK